MLSMLLVALFRSVSAFPVAYAQKADPNETTNYVLPNPLGTDSFLDVINRILQGLTIIAIPIVAIIVVIGGFKLIVGGGSPESRTSAKNMILWSAIGFGILLLADSVALIVQSFLSS